MDTFHPTQPTGQKSLKQTKKKNIEQHFSLKTKFLTGLKRSLYCTFRPKFCFSAKWEWKRNFWKWNGSFGLTGRKISRVNHFFRKISSRTDPFHLLFTSVQEVQLQSRLFTPPLPQSYYTSFFLFIYLFIKQKYVTILTIVYLDKYSCTGH